MPRTLRFAHGSNPSIDSDTEGLKVSEMLDGSTGGLAESLVPDTPQVNVETTQELMTDGTAVPIKSTKAKSSAKRHKRKPSKIPPMCTGPEGSVVNVTSNPMHVLPEAPPMAASLVEASTDISAPAGVATQLSKSATPIVKPASKKSKKSKRSTTTDPELPQVQELQVHSQTIESQDPAQGALDSPTTTLKAKSRKPKKSKQTNYIESSPMNSGETGPHPESSAGCTTIKANSVPTQSHASITKKSAQQAEQMSKHNKSKSLVKANQTDSKQTQHSRQKSRDLRLKVNGTQRDLTMIDSPLPPLSTSFRITKEEPVKIKLPGQAEKLVWSEEYKRVRQGGPSTSASSFRSESSAQGGHDMRSRQSSHTTVGTDGALESKLQHMILSNTQASNAFTPSGPEVMHNPLTTQSPFILAESNPTFATQSPNRGLSDRAPNFDHRTSSGGEINGPPGVQLPAVPTLYDSRPSQMLAPPSLGPPQPQNLPEQIPSSHGSFASNPQMHHPAAFAPQYPMVAYPNYYVPQQQFYNPYTQMASPMNSYYEPQPYENGTVYYSPDGTPVQYYPQQFYNPYHPQHYNY